MDSINPQYATAKEQVKDVLEENGFTMLANILADGFRSGLEDGLAWEDSSVPDMHRYEKADADALDDTLAAITDYLSEVLGRSLSAEWKALRRYSVGSYTLQHDEQPPAGLFITLFLTDHWDKTFRGEVTVVPPEGDPLKVPPQDDALLIVERSEDMNVFVKRVTHKAEDASYVALHAVLR